MFDGFGCWSILKYAERQKSPKASSFPWARETRLYEFFNPRKFFRLVCAPALDHVWFWRRAVGQCRVDRFFHRFRSFFQPQEKGQNSSFKRRENQVSEHRIEARTAAFPSVLEKLSSATLAVLAALLELGDKPSLHRFNCFCRYHVFRPHKPVRVAGIERRSERGHQPPYRDVIRNK